MAKYRPGRRPTIYRPTRESFPIMEALAVAVAVDAAHGFQRAGQGRYDKVNKVRIDDNRVMALRTLRFMRGQEPAPDPDGAAQPMFIPTATDHEAALEVYEHFSQIIVMAKLSDSLTQPTRDGRVNNFNQILSEIYKSGTVDINKQLAMLVSLPNSLRVSATRERMQTFFSNNKANGYIGELTKPASRTSVSGKVMDVKFIPEHRIHLVTVHTTDDKIATFIMNSKQQAQAREIAHTDITFEGNVTKHQVNPHTDCQQTMLSRVKFK